MWTLSSVKKKHVLMILSGAPKRWDSTGGKVQERERLKQRQLAAFDVPILKSHFSAWTEIKRPQSLIRNTILFWLNDHINHRHHMRESVIGDGAESRHVMDEGNHFQKLKIISPEIPLARARP